MVTIHVPVVHLDLYHSPSIAFAECFEGKSEGFPVGVDIVLDDLGPVDYGEGAVFIGFADGEERITSPKPKPVFSVQLQATEVEFENLSAGENLLGDYCDGLLRVIGRRSSASHSNHPSGQASSLCRDDLPKTAFAGTEEVMVFFLTKDNIYFQSNSKYLQNQVKSKHSTWAFLERVGAELFGVEFFSNNLNIGKRSDGFQLLQIENSL